MASDRFGKPFCNKDELVKFAQRIKDNWSELQLEVHPLRSLLPWEVQHALERNEFESTKEGVTLTFTVTADDVKEFAEKHSIELNKDPLPALMGAVSTFNGELQNDLHEMVQDHDGYVPFFSRKGGSGLNVSRLQYSFKKKLRRPTERSKKNEETGGDSPKGKASESLGIDRDIDVLRRYVTSIDEDCRGEGEIANTIEDLAKVHGFYFGRLRPPMNLQITSLLKRVKEKAVFRAISFGTVLTAKSFFEEIDRQLHPKNKVGAEMKDLKQIRFFIGDVNDSSFMKVATANTGRSVADLRTTINRCKKQLDSLVKRKSEAQIRYVEYRSLPMGSIIVIDPDDEEHGILKIEPYLGLEDTHFFNLFVRKSAAPDYFNHIVDWLKTEWAESGGGDLFGS